MPSKKPHLKNSKQQESSSSRKGKKEKGKTQKPPMESYMHMGPTGKKTMRKRSW